MLSTYDFFDPARAGIIGWSHGGMITLMNIFAHPKDWAAAYAVVPVSDFVTRSAGRPCLQPAGYR